MKINRRVLFGTSLIIGILMIAGVFAINMNQGLKVYVQPVSFLYFPQNMVYDHRMVETNISNNFYGDISYTEKGEDFYRICRNCIDFGYSRLKRLPFDDGFHQVMFFSQFENYKLYNYINFTVDTHKPVMRDSYPKGKFANGTFSTEFYEENPIAIGLIYGNYKIGFKYQALNISSCFKIFQSRTKCNIKVNLSDYDTSEISYLFNITDILGGYAESKPKKVMVDFTSPKIIAFNYTRDIKNKNRVNFFFYLDEPNFKVINYIDYSERNPVPRLLCQSLKNNRCEKYKIFSGGYHNLTIEILDQTGNINRVGNIIV